MSRQLSLVAALALLASLAVVAPAAPAPGPGVVTKAMVLTLRDLPPGYDLTTGHYVTNAELKRKDPAWKDYAQLGRIAGYNASYKTLGIGGMTAVDAFASVYKTGVGAHNSLMLTLVQAHEQDGTKLLLAGPGLLGGDTLVYRMKGSGSNEDLYAVAWRRGSVLAEVIGAGRTGTVDVADVVALAKKQDSRIARALKRP